MLWITRKLTEKVVATDVPEADIATVLSALPTGVYAIESANGIELAEAVVRGGRVTRYSFADKSQLCQSGVFGLIGGCIGCVDRAECAA